MTVHTAGSDMIKPIVLGLNQNWIMQVTLMLGAAMHDQGNIQCQAVNTSGPNMSMEPCEILCLQGPTMGKARPARSCNSRLDDSNIHMMPNNSYLGFC